MEVDKLQEFKCEICKKVCKNDNLENKFTNVIQTRFCNPNCFKYYKLLNECRGSHDCSLCKYLN
jgi:hypothetical protein